MNRRRFTAGLAVLAMTVRAGAASRISSRRLYMLQPLRRRAMPPCAGPPSPGSFLLEAQIGSHVPHVLMISEIPSVSNAKTSDETGAILFAGPSLPIARGNLFELRTYPQAPRSLLRMFPRAGIEPMLSTCSGAISLLIPFENLSAREQAWNRLNADPAWLQIRDQAGPYQFALYRVAA